MLTGYETYSLEKLIYNYLWEKGRVNKDDMKQTQDLIMKEIDFRYKRLRLMLQDKDNTDKDAQAILKRLLEG